ncbi:ABC transporter permease [Nonomuraea sp. SYSU D8015]|uniref:ABC transporter permease n=1 Tax=Nonomuraea sp. SYSU D8015 TaxID=2593644 RepID=UPI001660D3DB|nr:ABC transporter permease [Nonomuraea sp. SYSU D8015]
MSLTELKPLPVEEAAPVAGRGPLALAWRRLRRDPAAVASATVIAVLVAVALAAPLIAALTGHGPADQYRDTGLTPDGLPVPPSGRFWLGTDNLGRDVLVRVVYGTRISLLVGVAATVLAVAAGLVAGLVSGYFGGAVDTALARFMDVVLSFPFLLFAIALVSIAGPSLSVSVAVIAFFSWAAVGRIVRGQTLSIREREYIEAARSLGASDLRIMAVDVLPNLIAPVIVYGTLLIPVAIVFEATLSFLGLGVLPPTPSWGNMLADSLQYYQVAWWFALFPGLALLVTTLAFNLLGDAVRDALAPGSGRG